MIRRFSISLRGKLIFIISFILVVFSNIYLAGKTSYSPYYFAYVLSMILYIFYLLRKSVIYVPRSVYVSLIFIIYIVFSGLIRNDLMSTRVWLVSQTSFICSSIVLVELSKKQLYKISRWFVWISIFMLLIEFFYRLSHPNLLMKSNLLKHNVEGIGGFLFYIYKTSSIMFLDSNFVGLLIICLFFYCYYLQKYRYLNYKKELFILFVLNILTFSRSSVIALILSCFIFKFYHYSKHSLLAKILLYLSLFFSIVGMPFILFFLGDVDVSFLARLNVILDSIKVFRSDLLLFMFGGGFNSSDYYVGRGAHVLYMTIMFASGFIGLLIFFVQCLFISLDTKLKAVYIILPFLIAGISLGDLFSFFYIPLALIYAIERTNK